MKVEFGSGTSRQSGLRDGNAGSWWVVVVFVCLKVAFFSVCVSGSI